jgi:hypothetical protein
MNDNEYMKIGATRPIPDALALEYKRDYGTARGDLDITDLVNNPTANCECRVLGLGFQEQPVDLFPCKLRPLLDNPCAEKQEPSAILTEEVR